MSVAKQNFSQLFIQKSFYIASINTSSHWAWLSLQFLENDFVSNNNCRNCVHRIVNSRLFKIQFMRKIRLRLEKDIQNSVQAKMLIFISLLLIPHNSLLISISFWNVYLPIQFLQISRNVKNNLYFWKPTKMLNKLSSILDLTKNSHLMMIRFIMWRDLADLWNIIRKLNFVLEAFTTVFYWM